MRFSTTAIVSNYGHLRALCEVVDRPGFEMLCVPDSSTGRELFISLGVAAQATRHLRLSAMTTLGTRHPALLASGLGSLAELSGGRAILCLGRGDSAVRNLGLGAARLEDLRRDILFLRQLFAEGKGLYNGTIINMPWLRGPASIFVMAEGPRSLALAGELADGVIVGTGLTSQVIHDSLEHLREGAVRADRDPAAIELWWQAKWTIAQSTIEARKALRASVAASAARALATGHEFKLVPLEHRGPLRRLAERCLWREVPGAIEHNARVVDELGLADYLVDRFGIGGTVADCIQRITDLEVSGVRRLHMVPFGPDRVALQRVLSERIVPHFCGMGALPGERN